MSTYQRTGSANGVKLHHHVTMRSYLCKSTCVKVWLYTFQCLVYSLVHEMFLVLNGLILCIGTANE